jgi:O-antigen ligase
MWIVTNRKKHPITKDTVISMLPFLLVGAVSLLLQLPRFSLGTLAISALYLVRFGIYFLLLPIFASSPRYAKHGLRILWYSGVVMAFLGLVQYVLYPNLRNLGYLGWDPHEFRLFSTLLDPNFTGIILVLTLFVGWYWYLEEKFTKPILLSLQALVLLALFLTYSRGSYIAFLAGLFVLAYFYRKIRWFVYAGVLFLVLLLLLPRPSGEGVNLLRHSTIAARAENTFEALALVRTSPLLGFGFNTLRYVRNQNKIVPGTESLSHSGAGFHNSFLFIMATTGIIGLLAYMWFWKRAAELITGAGRHTQLVILTASVTAIFMHSIFDNSLFFPLVMAWMWILMGSILGNKPVKSER